jgi:hypothetical protein
MRNVEAKSTAHRAESMGQRELAQGREAQGSKVVR